MSKSLISYVIAVVIVVAVIFGVSTLNVHAQTQTPSQTPAYSPAPSTGGSSSSAGQSTGGSSSSASAPSTGGTSSSAGGSGAPSTGGSSSSAAPSTGGSTSSAGAQSTPAPVSGGSVSVSSSGSYGSYSSVSTGSVCLPINSYMRIGANNNAVDVAKLQTFLKNTEKLNVDVTGTFDSKTEAAVIAFQNKYFETTMAPWGATKATGNVYITTLKKINQLACNQALNLTPAELAIINAYKSSNLTKAPVTAPAESQEIQIGKANPSNTPVVTLTPETPNKTQATPSPEVGYNGENTSAYTAAAGNASILHRFWSFIVSLFK